MTVSARWGVSLVLSMSALATGAQNGGTMLSPDLLLRNGSFEQGEGTPVGWSLTGSGAWGNDGGAEGSRYITVMHAEGGQWRSDPVAFRAGATYELRLRCRYRPGALSARANAVVGPAFAIRMVPLSVGADVSQWQSHAVRFVVPTPVDPELSRIGLWQWQLNGAIDYDAVELYPVKPVHRSEQGMVLGEGERITGNAYRFVDPLGSLGGISRPLASYSGRFHDNRWRFPGPEAEVVYRHHIAGRRQLSASVRPTVWFHEESSWHLVVEASVDGQRYRHLGTVRYGEPTPSFDIPADMLPADSVWIRLRNDASDGAHPVFFQVNGYEYDADLDGAPGNAVGATSLLTILGEDPNVTVEPLVIDPATAIFAVKVTNAGDATLVTEPTLQVTHESGQTATYPGSAQSVGPGDSATVTIAYEVSSPGRHDLRFSLGPRLRTVLSAEAVIPILHAGHYGECLPSPDSTVALWWASSGWKVSRTRRPPRAVGNGILLRLAGNEAEGVQIVVRSERGLTNLRAEAGDLRPSASAGAPAPTVEVLRVGYVAVEYASDRFGCVDDWPDPLPPFPEGIDVPAGKNQPLWVHVRAPEKASGRYQGVVRLRADGFEADIPLGVEVYSFALPERSACRSLFGFDWGNVVRYHKLTTDEQRRDVLDKYLRSFSSHRVSPYNPAPLDGFSYAWQSGLDWEGGKLVRNHGHSGVVSLMIEDTSAAANASAHYAPLMPVSGKPLRLSLWRRTAAADEPAYAYLCHFDGGKTWFYGKNRAIAIPPALDWQPFETTVPSFPEGTRFVRLMVQPCQYSEAGERTGNVWIDDVSVVDMETGAELLAGGDFESAQPIGAATGVTFDWEAWDAAMAAAVSRYHFNGFVFGVPGLGGGTFHSRSPGTLLGYPQGTPEHLALLRTWCDAAREHLETQGLLEKAVCYPFDEPAEKDYPFVVEQLRLLEETFPGLHRMVPMNLGAADDFVGHLDYWCPILSSHNPAFAEERRKAGDLYTWYICCGPKAPYIANFIDRPATDLRVWLWQTWQKSVDGILIWQSLYWHSPPAYPDRLQNPYEDSMSWVRGYDTKPGERRRWNAGDGRFMYPPMAATGMQEAAILDGPVSSMRWEALRDGLEDYEYMAMLRGLLKRRRADLDPERITHCEGLLRVPPTISASLTNYTRDPAPIEARRHEIALAIEGLLRPSRAP